MGSLFMFKNIINNIENVKNSIIHIFMHVNVIKCLHIYIYIITYCKFAPQEPVRNAKDVKTSAHILPGRDGKEPVKI